MGRVPCCSKEGLRKGPWTPDEDQKLVDYITLHGHTNWRALPKKCGLLRCGKSCRLRWTNYLRPDIKRGKFSYNEEQKIIHLHAIVGNKWAFIASQLPQRTDNEIKNYWNTVLRKRFRKANPNTIAGLRQKATDNCNFTAPDKSLASNISNSFGHLAQWESARLQAEARLAIESEMRAEGKWRRLPLHIPAPSKSSDPRLSLPQSDVSSLIQPKKQPLFPVVPPPLVHPSRQDQIIQLLAAALSICASSSSSKIVDHSGTGKLKWCPSDEEPSISQKLTTPDEGTNGWSLLESLPKSNVLTEILHLLSGRREKTGQGATSDLAISSSLEKSVPNVTDEEMVTLEDGHCRIFQELQDLLLGEDNGSPRWQQSSCISPRWQQSRSKLHDSANDASCSADSEANLVGSEPDSMANLSNGTKLLEPLPLFNNVDISELDVYHAFDQGRPKDSQNEMQEDNSSENDAFSCADHIDKTSSGGDLLDPDCDSMPDVNSVNWHNLLMQLFD